VCASCASCVSIQSLSLPGLDLDHNVDLILTTKVPVVLGRAIFVFRELSRSFAQVDDTDHREDCSYRR
jgi:hypothetical protein